MTRILAWLAISVLLTACASGGYGYRDDYRYSRCQDCGVVERIEVARYGDGRTSGGGAVAGAIIGGIVGSQIGSGSGRDAATVAGAIAGGVAGNKIESDQKARDVYAIFVRMDDGRRRVYEQRDLQGLREGDRVEIRQGRVRLR